MGMCPTPDTQLENIMQLHTTGAHPFCHVRQAARLGGCLDAPDFVATGSTSCELSTPVWGRDEVAVHLEAFDVIAWLRRATSQSYLIDAHAEAWLHRTRGDIALVHEYVRTLGIEDAADLIERTAWDAMYLDDQDARMGGNPGPWGSLVAEADFGLNYIPAA